MEEKEKQQIIHNANVIWQRLKDELDSKIQTMDSIQYYKEFEFVGSGLAEKDIYIVKIQNQEIDKEHNINKANDKGKNSKNIKTKDQDTKDFKTQDDDKLDQYATYQIYDKDNNQIATVGKDGKIQFSPEYLKKLQEINPKLYKILHLEGLDFQLPEELKENDMTLTEADLEENEQKVHSSSAQDRKDKEKEGEPKEGKKDIDSENMEERKQEAAKVLGCKPEEIKGLSQINPNEKVTDTDTLRNILPESKDYDRIEIACTTNGSKQGDARFSILGIKKDGTREALNSISSVEGVSTNKKVISINEDGSRVEEKAMQGLFRINSRDREDGMSVSLGDYGMLDISYVRNVMDKENRRSTPLKTLDSQNRHEPNEQVRQNAGDSKEEIEKESSIYRQNQEEGIDPQSLDAIDTQNNNIEFVKQRIIANALEQGEMSNQELTAFVEEQVGEQTMNLTREEKQQIIKDIKERVLDESRFPVRGEKNS